MKTVTPDKVVDASVVAAILFSEPRADEASRLLGDSKLHAPHILPVELCSVALKKMRLLDSQKDKLERELELAAAFDVTLVTVRPRDVLRLAFAMELSAYDACYLQVARLLDCQLVTFDKKLAAAARSARRV